MESKIIPKKVNPAKAGIISALYMGVIGTLLFATANGQESDLNKYISMLPGVSKSFWGIVVVFLFLLAIGYRGGLWYSHKYNLMIDKGGTHDLIYIRSRIFFLFLAAVLLFFVLLGRLIIKE